MTFRRIYPILIIFSLAYFLSGADLLQRFMPRSVCMFNHEVLIKLHLISDGAIFVASMGIGIILIIIYDRIKHKGFPYAKFFWKFGGFIVFNGITHLIGVLNIFVTYYWIDGMLKLITGWFELLVFISLVDSFPGLKNIRTPTEFEQLKLKLDEVIDHLKKNKNDT